MVDVDDSGGQARVWRSEPVSHNWHLVARGLTRLAALVDAEKLIRAELTQVQELLHQAKEAERANRV